MAKKKSTEVIIDTRIIPVNEDFVYWSLPIPAWGVTDLTGGKTARVLCEINGFEFPCALRKSKEGDFYITLSKEKAKKSRCIEGAEVSVKIRLDESEYGFPMPEELAEVFAQDPEGKIAFDSLLPGQRRGWIYHVDSAKSIDVRIKRALDIVEKSKVIYWEKKSKQ
jgi:hypothetical protein